MPSYYSFSMHVPEVVILSESHSLHLDHAMSSARFDSLSNDTKATHLALISPRSVLPESCVPSMVDLVDLVPKDEEEDLEEKHIFRRIHL